MELRKDSEEDKLQFIEAYKQLLNKWGYWDESSRIQFIVLTEPSNSQKYNKANSSFFYGIFHYIDLVQTYSWAVVS